MREIILDTETTGIARKVDRVVEIGCVELVDLVPTGRTFHKYVNPQHPVHREAFKVHGLSDEFLKTKPTFRRIVRQFLEFVGDATLVAHNAPFDLGMLNDELERLEMPVLTNEVVDTLALARQVRPGKRHTLDALCRSYDINLGRREKHGGLLDAELLAEVYIELRGGRQFGMHLQTEVQQEQDLTFPAAPKRPVPLVRTIGIEEWKAHQAFVQTLGKQAIWLDYRGEKQAEAA